MASFEKVHGENTDKLLRYQANGRKGSVRLDRAILDEFDPTAAIDLHANNPDARIRFARIATQHLQRFADEAEDTFFHWVTLCPGQFGVVEDVAAQFNIKRIHAWTHQSMRGLDYVGMVEAALFGNFGVVVPTRNRMVSWHVHLLVWGVTEARMTETIAVINSKYNSLVPGILPAYAELIPKHLVTAKVAYMVKAPRSEHRVIAKRRTEVDPSTGEITRPRTGRFKVKKQDLRPRDMARMAEIMAGKYLHKLAFAGGDGKPSLKAIRIEALKPLQNFKIRARAGVLGSGAASPQHRRPDPPRRHRPKPTSHRRPMGPPSRSR